MLPRRDHARFLQGSLPIAFLVSLLSCESTSILPLEAVLRGDDPGALDWDIPTGRAPLRPLEQVTGTDVAALPQAKRAMLQRDLWMAFDGRFYDPPDPLVRERLAPLLRRLALTSDEIRALPDTYALATQTYPSQFDPQNPAQPFLPKDLLDPSGPWLLLGSDIPVARRHEESFNHRSTFLVFVRHPEGRQATVAYVEGLRSNKLPGVYIGMEFVLLRRANLINKSGEIVPSPITESVQVRHYRGLRGGEQSFFKFELRREDFRLHSFGIGERKPSYARSFEHEEAQVSIRRPVLDTCVNCHDLPGGYGVQTFFRRISSPVWLDTLRVGGIEQEQSAVVKRKEKDESWKALVEMWGR
jgi:hypothetical protein